MDPMEKEENRLVTRSSYFDKGHAKTGSRRESFPEVEVDGVRFNAEYMFPDASIFVKVDELVYALHCSVLERCSVFRDLACLPPQPEGKTPHAPLDLTATTSTEEWMYFLDFLYNTRPENKQPLEFYFALLRLGSMWNHAWCREYAIARLSVHQDLHLPKKVNLALKFEVYEWIRPAFRELCQIPVSVLTKEDVALLGSDFFYKLVLTQCRLADERLCVAYSEPRLKWAGEGTCEGSKDECEQGWKGAWWSYGAKMLLHPDCPKTADDVAKELLRLRNVEGICDSCWLLTVQSLPSQCQAMQRHLNALIEEDGDRLMPFDRYILNREMQLA